MLTHSAWFLDGKTFPVKQIFEYSKLHSNIFEYENLLNIHLSPNVVSVMVTIVTTKLLSVGKFLFAQICFIGRSNSCDIISH